MHHARVSTLQCVRIPLLVLACYEGSLPAAVVAYLSRALLNMLLFLCFLRLAIQYSKSK